MYNIIIYISVRINIYTAVFEASNIDPEYPIFPPVVVFYLKSVSQFVQT